MTSILFAAIELSRFSGAKNKSFTLFFKYVFILYGSLRRHRLHGFAFLTMVHVLFCGTGARHSRLLSALKCTEFLPNHRGVSHFISNNSCFSASFKDARFHGSLSFPVTRCEPFLLPVVQEVEVHAVVGCRVVQAEHAVAVEGLCFSSRFLSFCQNVTRTPRDARICGRKGRQRQITDSREP